MTTTNKKRNTIIIAIAIIVLAVITAFVLKLNYDKKVEAERVIAMQAQVEADKAEQLKAEAEKLVAEKLAAEKLAAEKLAAEKLAAEKAEAEKLQLEQAEKDAAVLKEKSDAAVKEALEKEAAKKAKEEKAESGKTDGGKTNGGKSEIESPGKPESKPSDPGFDNYPGNLPEDEKRMNYEGWKDYIGGPEPQSGAVAELQHKLVADGRFVILRWRSDIGMWERKDDDGVWKLICPETGNGFLHKSFGLETPTE